MPEILDAYERDGNKFGVVRIKIAESSATFEFGVQEAGYRTLKRILESRPFSTTPGLPHRCFFARTASKICTDSARRRFTIRIESGQNSKGFEFEGPLLLAQNLIWFANLTSFDEASTLRRLA